MLIQFTLCSLVILLIAVIALSYYANKEGFDNITVSSLQNEKPATISLDKLQQLFNSIGCAKKLTEEDVKWWRTRPTMNDIINDMKAYAELTSKCAGSEGQHSFCDPTKCRNTSTITIQPKQGSLVDLCFKEGETNAMVMIEQSKCPAGSKYPYQINKLTSINTSSSFSPGECSFSRNQQNTSEAQKWNLTYLGDCNNEPQYWKQVVKANTVDSIPNISPTTSASSAPAPVSTTPQRNVVVPEVTLSDSGYNAMKLQQKKDLLKDIQKVVRNEILANRMTTPMIKEKENDKIFSDYDSEESDSTMQGKEYESNCQKMNGEEEYRCPKNSNGSCPPVPDMTQYIKKDAIPCWGCSIQY